MPLLHLALVALIQGITEFLPVSSSGHLILLPHLTGLDDQGIAIDVAAHIGTLFAVMLFYRQEVTRLFSGTYNLLTGKFDTPDARLTILLIIATIPVIIAGLLVKLSGLDVALRSVLVIGVMTLVFGIVLWIADRRGDEVKKMSDWTFSGAITLGLWQAVALIPGASRSGVTITGARFLGFERHEAVRIAMLMSIPTIIASGVLLIPDVAFSASGVLRDIAIVAALSFAAALAALALMVRLLNALSFTPYVIYRIILGVGLIVFALTS